MPAGVPCRFYSRGLCRYGDSCHFVHEQPFAGQQQQQQTYFTGAGRMDPRLQSQQGGFNTAKPHNAPDPRIVVEGMFKDLAEWEQVNFWPFTSYGPIGDKPCIPYFQDYSQEEIRFMTLQNGGRPPPELTNKLAEISKTRQHIMQNYNLAKQILDDVINPDNPSPFSAKKPQVFSQSSSPTVSNFFNSSSQQQQISAGSGLAQATSIFGGSSPPSQSIFGGRQQSATSIFGGGSPQPQQSPTSIFGGSPQSQQVFGGGQSQQQSPNSIFGGSSSPAAMSGFSFNLAQNQQQQQQSPQFASQPGMDAIDMSATNTPSSTAPVQSFSFNQAFAQTQNIAPSAKTFTFAPSGQGPTAPTPFSNAPVGGLGTFGANTSPFQQQPTSGLAAATGFFSSTISGSGIGGIQQTVSSTAYSQMSDLTPEEIKEYEADRFTSCETIPLKPPPREMCLRN